MKKLHMHDFEGNKNNRCVHCNKTFNSKGSLATHIRKYHTQVTCMICSVTFASDATLRVHMINIHKLPTDINIFN